MTGSRLERAEDSYEFLVLASMSNLEVTNTDIRGYVYNIGRGVTTDNMLSPDKFLMSASQIKSCWEEAKHFADSTESVLVKESATRLKERLTFTLMNEWKDRVSDNDKIEAAKSVAPIIGEVETATALMRFARDGAYASIEYLNPSTSAFLDWAALAEELTQDVHVLPVSYTQMKDAASRHIQEFKETQDLHKRQKKQTVKIFVSAHKLVSTFSSDIFQPVHVGSAKNPPFPIIGAMPTERTSPIAIHAIAN